MGAQFNSALYHFHVSFQLKLVATICVLLVMIECTSWADATTNPNAIHLRQKRGSGDFLGKIKNVSQNTLRAHNVIIDLNAFEMRIFYGIVHKTKQWLKQATKGETATQHTTTSNDS